ncbi:Glycosyl hydrolase family 3 C-terminal domain [Rhizoctonia solani]|uniref:beta-glucosidase n=1 Tax=Rhizoctonia solani TaxID=456999 RepID=A0A8H7I7W6_9AGAM|nr:Glycosyl hydrolase family 3 C-terminal domain [Rhizoctonia solani]
MSRRGNGLQAQGKGCARRVGPMMNLGRVAAGGRNWEGFGADPYHVGEASYETIIGIQDEGVLACAKHYINKATATSSSNVGDRTQHELYAHPFLRSVMAGLQA